MPVTIGGGQYNIGQSYMDELARQRAFQLQQAQLDQAQQESQRRAQAAAAQSRNQYAIEEMRTQAAMAQHAAEQGQQQQFHGDQMAQERARLRQQGQLANQNFQQGVVEHGDTLKHWQNLEQTQRDLKAQTIQQQQDARDQQASVRTNAEQERRRQVVAHNLERNADEAERYAMTPEDQQVVQAYRQRAQDVVLNKIDPENATDVLRPLHSLPPDVPGPQPKPLPTLEEIRANANQRKEQDRTDSMDIRREQVTDVKENRAARLQMMQEAAANKFDQAEQKKAPTRAWVSTTNDLASTKKPEEQGDYKAYRIAQLKGVPLPGNKFYEDEVTKLGQKAYDDKATNMLFKAPDDPKVLERMIRTNGEEAWQTKHNRQQYEEKGVNIEDAEKAIKGAKTKATVTKDVVEKRVKQYVDNGWNEQAARKKVAEEIGQ